MKKLLALLLLLLLTFSLVACGNNDSPDPSGSDNPGVSQSGENDDDQGSESTVGGSEENDSGESTVGGSEENDSGESTVGGGENTNGETDSKPWPENELTKLLPTPAQGKVSVVGGNDTFTMIEVSWTYDEVLAYVHQLKEAGFGDDIVEKFEQQKTINRTHNGVNIYLVYMNDETTSITLMPA